MDSIGIFKDRMSVIISLNFPRVVIMKGALDKLLKHEKPKKRESVIHCIIRTKIMKNVKMFFF